MLNALGLTSMQELQLKYCFQSTVLFSPQVEINMAQGKIRSIAIAKEIRVVISILIEYQMEKQNKQQPARLHRKHLLNILEENLKQHVVLRYMDNIFSAILSLVVTKIDMNYTTRRCEVRNCREVPQKFNGEWPLQITKLILRFQGKCYSNYLEREQVCVYVCMC